MPGERIDNFPVVIMTVLLVSVAMNQFPSNKGSRYLQRCFRTFRHGNLIPTFALWCSSPHAEALRVGGVWATGCANAADENSGIRPSTNVG